MSTSVKKHQKFDTPQARNGLKTYRFIRRKLLQTITAESASEVINTWRFRLSDISGYTEFQSLFDEYKIEKVEITIQRVSQGFSLVTSGSTLAFFPPTMYTAIDYTDATGVDIDLLSQYQSCKMHYPSQSVTKVVVTPKFQVETYSGGYSTSSGFVNCTYPSIDHYGVKYAIEPTGGVDEGIYQFKVDMKYFLTFRNTK
jgi:hypothetical protein